MADSINITLSGTPSAEPFLPTATQKAALAGTGTPSSMNKYVTDDTLATIREDVNELKTGKVFNKSYAAFLTQTGESDPVATELNSANTDYVGGIVWTRTDTGTYTGYLAGKFPVNKTICHAKINRSNLAGDEWNCDLNRVNDNAVELLVWDTSNSLTDGFNSLQIEITTL